MSVFRRIISTANAPKAIGPYSQAVQVDKTLYISGCLGMVPGGTDLVEGGIKSETEQALKNMGAILHEAGANYGNVVKTTILLADMNDFATVNEIYAKFFTDRHPARACYQVAALPKQGRVEIEAVAIVADIKEQ